MQTYQFEINPASVQLRVCARPQYTTLQLRVPAALMHPGMCRNGEEAAFVCGSYRETERTRYTAPDWLPRFR